MSYNKTQRAHIAMVKKMGASIAAQTQICKLTTRLPEALVVKTQ